MPNGVTLPQMQAAMLLLGIPFEDLVSVFIEARRVSVVHLRRNDLGNLFAAGGDIATTTRTLPVVVPYPPDLKAARRAAARSRLRAARHTR